MITHEEEMKKAPPIRTYSRKRKYSVDPHQCQANLVLLNFDLLPLLFRIIRNIQYYRS